MEKDRKKRISRLLKQTLDLMTKEKLSVEESIVFCGNLTFSIATSIEPSIPTDLNQIEKYHISHTSLASYLALTGIDICALPKNLESLKSFDKTLEKIEKERKE